MSAVQITGKIKSYSVVPQGQASPPANFVSDEADRRLKLDEVQVPLADSLRWESRPEISEGNPAHVFQVKGPVHEFFVIVSYVRNGSPTTGYPFEVPVSGEAPRAINALAKSLSMDMRSRDRAWLKRKLESIGQTEGEAFEMVMPDGRTVRMPSEVAAFARLVHHQCEQLGAFSKENLAHTPVLDALMSKRRPLTTPDGTVSWCCDVINDRTGDKFKVILPELVLPDGRKRPYELWFSGKYPRESLDGLAKSLSLDLQVNDVDWSLRKLRQLTSIVEDRGEIWARVPGSDKQQCYPSTIAYVAELVLHRLRMLGLVDENGAKGPTVVVSIAAARKPAKVDVVAAAQDCPECRTVGSYVATGGCAVCTECSYSTCSG